MKVIRSKDDAKSIFSALVAAAALMGASAALKFLDLGSGARLLVALLPVPAYILYVLGRGLAARRYR